MLAREIKVLFSWRDVDDHDELRTEITALRAAMQHHGFHPDLLGQMARPQPPPYGETRVDVVLRPPEAPWVMEHPGVPPLPHCAAAAQADEHYGPLPEAGDVTDLDVFRRPLDGCVGLLARHTLPWRQIPHHVAVRMGELWTNHFISHANRQFQEPSDYAPQWHWRAGTA